MKLHLLKRHTNLDVESETFEVKSDLQLAQLLIRFFELSGSRATVGHVISHMKTKLYKEFVNSRFKFDQTFALYLPQFEEPIGFCDSDLSELKDEEVPSDLLNPNNEMFYIDPSRVEHNCCWSSMIVRKRTQQEIDKGYTQDPMYVECDADQAEFICAALNKAWKEK